MFAFAYPLQPIHLTLLSWLTIGVPAFFLALEPNDQRVTEGFLQRVLGRAIPAGVVIALSTMSVFSLVQLDESIDAEHARTVAVLVAGLVALMNLARVSMPLNRLRLTLVLVMTALFALAFATPLGRRVFELPQTAGWAYGVAIAFAALAWPLLVLGSRISAHVYDRRRASGTSPRR